MSDSYVCSKAKIKCSCGDKISTLTVFPDRTIWLTREPQANISDNISMRNIAPFGRCHTTRYPATGAATAAAHGKLTPMPCVPNTPFPWMGGKDDVILKGHPALLKSSTCKCVWGGTISIIFDGQTGISNKDVDKEEKSPCDDLDNETVDDGEVLSILDGIQLALDAAGFIPGLGAAPDLLNAAISACRGDWGGAGISLIAAIPIIGDAAAGARLCYKGAKIAGKVNVARKSILSKATKNFIGKNIPAEKLLKYGICKNKAEVKFFQKSLRQERKKFAYQYYKSKGLTDKKDILSNINGIDLDHPVRIRKMPPPYEFQRFEAKDGKIGSYMSIKRNPGEPINSPRKYGIMPVAPNKAGKMERKVKRIYKIEENTPPFDFLESTASPCKAPINDNWKAPKSDSVWRKTKGGATQYYVPRKYLGSFIRIK